MKRKRNLKVGDGLLPSAVGERWTGAPRAWPALRPWRARAAGTHAARPDGGLLAWEVGTTGGVRQALSSAADPFFPFVFPVFPRFFW
jgi:hypothetical protein